LLCWQILANNPDRRGIFSGGAQAIFKMAGREFVVVIHRPDVSSATSQSNVIAIAVETATRSAQILTAECVSDPFDKLDLIVIRVVRDDDFPRLSILCPQ
jgi:hypothetical protein